MSEIRTLINVKQHLYNEVILATEQNKKVSQH